jgi:hypothetical protein
LRAVIEGKFIVSPSNFALLIYVPAIMKQPPFIPDMHLSIVVFVLKVNVFDVPVIFAKPPSPSVDIELVNDRSPVSEIVLLKAPLRYIMPPSVSAVE